MPWIMCWVRYMYSKALRRRLTLNMRGSSYLGLTRSVSWLLMPWLLTSPGLQQPWYWLYRICRSCFYLKKDFKYLCHISMWRNDIKCKYMFLFSLNNLARKGLKGIKMYWIKSTSLPQVIAVKEYVWFQVPQMYSAKYPWLEPDIIDTSIWYP